MLYDSHSATSIGIPSLGNKATTEHTSGISLSDSLSDLQEYLNKLLVRVSFKTHPRLSQVITLNVSNLDRN